MNVRLSPGMPAALARIGIVLGLVLVCLTLLHIFASSNAGSRSSSRPLHLYGGINTSLSARPQLARFAHQETQLALRMQRGQDRLTLFRLDSDTQEFTDGVVNASMEQTQRQLAAQLGRVSKHDNTYEDEFWSAIYQRARKDTGPVIVILWTDGYNEGATPARRARLRKTVKRLAKVSHLSGVAIVGAKPATWARLRADLAPLQSRLGSDRFLICSDTDADIAPLARLLTPAP